MAYTDQNNKISERKAKCPHCLQPPPVGSFWMCSDFESFGCGHTFDTFETNATCPFCGRKFPLTQCINCGQWNPIEDYYRY
ncbi:MAG: hypothetical protein ACFFCM_06590 [Promethearchaeota archaeon]